MKKNRYFLSFIIMFTAIWTLSTLAQVESSTPSRDKADAVFEQSDNVQQIPPMKNGLRENYTQSDYENFVIKEKNGEIPSQSGFVYSAAAADALVNNNAGYTSGSGANFTQSETSIIAFGSNVLIGFNDSGSNSGGANKFTGFSYSTNGGTTFTDGGTFPTNSGGDAGDPVIARNEATGRIYFSTLGYSISTIQVFRSDNNGLTWMSPVNGTPGGSSEDKQWIAVDNFAGTGNGNVYLISRRFSGTTGIYMFRSTDNGNTFSPSGGVNIFSGGQGAFVAVGPDHSVYAFYYNGSTSILVRKSTDFGVSFGTAVTVFSGLTGGSNGDLGLVGIRQGTSTASSFRSNSFPHAAVNPVSGHIYVTFNDNPAGTDKADIFMTMSTDGGATWSARIRVNDDATTTDQWQPAIAVTPNGANIGIFYYSRQEDAANNLFKYYGRTGTISGSTVTFTPSFAISDVASLPEFGRDNVINDVYMGDYNHASATANEFHVLWSDNRDDLPGGSPRKDPNVYYEKILLGPPCPVGAPSNPNPVNGATNVSINLPQISWTNGAGATLCEVWFGPSGSMTKVYDGSIISSWTLPYQLSYNTSYNWQIINKNGTCSTSGSNWSFTTELSPGIVFTESFNNLNCWTAIGPLGTTNWSTQSTSNAGGTAPELRLNWSPQFNGLSKLKSCNISVLSNRNYTVSLKHMIDWYANTAPTLGLGVSYDNGATYTSVWSITPTGNVGPQTITASFTTPANATILNFVLYCNGNSVNIDYWYVDDILLNDDDYFAIANPTNVVATAINSSQINVSFTPNANNNNVVVVWNLSGTFTTPIGTPPAIGQPFAGGTLLYNGTTSPLIHNGLNPITTYFYKLFSFNGTSFSPGVPTSASTFNITDPTNVSATAINGSRIDLTFTPNTNNNNVIIVWNQTGTFTTPSGAPPVVGQPFAGGTLLYNGTVSPINHTGLNPLTTYFYKAFSYNGTNYSPGVTVNATTLDFGQAAVDIPITVSDNLGISAQIYFGLDLTATDGTDFALGEDEIPGAPPEGYFAAWLFPDFTTLSYKDYRAPGDPPAFPFTGHKSHIIRIQTDIPAGNPMTISWDLPPQIAATSTIGNGADTVSFFGIGSHTWNYNPVNLQYIFVEVDYIDTANTYELDVLVQNGWNMVSAPGINPAGMGVATWWPRRTGTVWGFNGTQYVSKTVATPGEGYWMKNTIAETYNYPAIQIVPHNPVPVTLGWNLIGGYETSPTVANLKLANPQITGTVWGFNGTQYVAAVSIVPGYSYWVRVTSAGTITIPDALAKGGEVVELYKEDWGRIVIRDAEGRSFTLYAVKGELDLNQYEMPPMPPAGVFDIRFSSGRVAEDINSAIQTIDMSRSNISIDGKSRGNGYQASGCDRQADKCKPEVRRRCNHQRCNNTEADGIR